MADVSRASGFRETRRSAPDGAGALAAQTARTCPSARGTAIAFGRRVSGDALGSHEARRSERCLLSVPIAVAGDGRAVVRAHTLVVNAHGALILCPCAFRADALLRVVNQDSGRTALCRVAWSGGEDLPGLFKLGIELLGDARDFWGALYAARTAPASPSRLD